MTDQPFGFKVKAPKSTEMPGYTYTTQWCVYLPHQCDEWQITNSYDGQPHADAIVQMERFIAEAQQALAALREGREFNAEAHARDEGLIP